MVSTCEVYDARMEIPGWDKPNLIQPVGQAVKVDPPGGRMRLR